MVFTFFHLGPALAIGLPLRKYIHTPTFVVANILPDIEPFLVLLLDISNYPLHGFAHTFMGAILMGFIISYTAYILRSCFNNILKILRLVDQEQKFNAYALAGISGTAIHVLIDSPLYSDIKPFYPLQINPLYNPRISSNLYITCALLILVSLTIYLSMLFKK